MATIADEVETIATANAKLSEYRRGRRQDWRRNSGSLEHSGKDLSRGLASLRSVKRIACVEPLTIQRDSGRTNILQTFKKRYLADRSRQAATPVSSSMPITTGCCGPGHLIQQRFGSILRMIAAPAAERLTNQERRRIERSEVIQGEEVSVGRARLETGKRSTK